MRLRRRAEQSTLWPAARRASPPRWQDDDRVLLTYDGSGLSSSTSCERLLPAGSWQRTLSESLASSLRALTGSAVSLRVRATKSGRSLLVPTTLGHRIDGSASGSWPTVHGMDNEGNRRRNGPTGNELGRAVTREEWATPNTMDGGQTSRGGKRKGELLLGGQVRQWPTARAEDSESAGAHVARGTAETLTAAARLWPTHTVSSQAQLAEDPYPGQTGGTTLVGEVLRQAGLWASPQARDWKDSGPTQGNRKSPNLGTQAWATPRTSDVAAGRIVEEGRRVSASGVYGINLSDQVAAGLLDQGSSSTSGKPAVSAQGSRGALCFLWVSQLLGFPNGWLEVPPSEYPML